MKDELFIWMMEESNRKGKRMSRDRRHSGSRMNSENFKCKQCGMLVVRAPYYSGVVNRNHCPYCLSSRHVDWQRAGDRMSACKGIMRPVALSLKHDNNKYSADSGELMIIHSCEECGQISINRIAADDSADELLAIFMDDKLLTERIQSRLQQTGIEWLPTDKRLLVYRRLFGSMALSQSAIL